MRVNSFGFGLVFLGGIAIGYLLNVIFKFEKFSFRNEVDPLSAISIVLSFIILVYISIVFEKVREGSRLKKDIVIKRCEDFLNTVEASRDSVSSDPLPFATVTYLAKRMYVKFESLNSFLGSADLPNQEFSNKFKSAHRELRDLTTRTSADPNATDHDIVVQDGIVRYSIERITEIEAVFDNITKVVTEVQIKVAVH